VGLTLAEDGTVHSIEDAVKMEGYENGGNGELAQELFLQSDLSQQTEQVKQEDLDLEQQDQEMAGDYVRTEPFVSPFLGVRVLTSRSCPFQMDPSMMEDQAAEEPEPAPQEQPVLPAAQTPSRAQTTTVPASSIQVGPDQQQVRAPFFTFWAFPHEGGPRKQTSSRRVGRVPKIKCTLGLLHGHRRRWKKPTVHDALPERNGPADAHSNPCETNHLGPFEQREEDHSHYANKKECAFSFFKRFK